MEEHVLMTVWTLKGEGYGVNVFQYLEKMHAGRITMGVVYDVMERLRKKGLLEARMGEPTPKRGGMRKKYYRMTNAGIEELARSKETHDRIMSGFNRLFKQYKVSNSS